MNWEMCVGAGWRPIVRDAVQKIETAGGKINDVKEKFGGLRIYCHSESDTETDIYKIIGEAQKQCSTICEECGMPGKVKSINGWYKTVCEKHSVDVWKDED